MALRQKVVIAPAWQKLLSALGWDGFGEIWVVREGDVLKGGRSTELRRVQFGHKGTTHTLYVKKYAYLTPRLRWSGFDRGTFLGVSKARAEFDNLTRLREWGLDAPAPVAYGEDRR